MTNYDEEEIIRTYRNASVKKVAVRTLSSRLGISIMEIADFLFANNEIDARQYGAYKRYNSADAEDRAAFEQKKAELMKAKGKTEPKKEQTITPLPSILPETPETVLKLCRDFLEDHKTEYFAARELVGEYEQIAAFIERGEKK